MFDKIKEIIEIKASTEKRVNYYTITGIIQNSNKKIRFPWYSEKSPVIGSLYQLERKHWMVKITGISQIKRN